MIQLSSSAVSEILRLQSKHRVNDSRLRITVAQGGCLDFAYSLSFDGDFKPDDQLCDCYPLQAIINSSDLPYLNGLVIDYSEDMMGGSFRFSNPNAAQVCGCGTSFSVILLTGCQ